MSDDNEIKTPGGRDISRNWFSQNVPLITIDQFKKQFLFGVDLRDQNGDAIADDVIAMFLSTAISFMEMQLNTPILPTRLIQKVDYDVVAYRQHSFIQVPIYPIREVISVKLKFKQNTFINFPETWWRIYENAGQIQMLPDVSTLSAVIIAQTGQLLPRAISGNFAPQMLEVDAIVGIADEEECVPPLINQAIGLYASLYLLQMIGDIGPGGSPGITAQSLSLDGMSQSVSTAISATNNLFGATIAKYESLLTKTVLPLLRKKYKRISLEYI
jgi:hypothetical protein